MFFGGRVFRAYVHLRHSISKVVQPIRGERPQTCFLSTFDFYFEDSNFRNEFSTERLAIFPIEKALKCTYFEIVSSN